MKPAFAHCDIPCGVYETDTMNHSAETCKRMVQKIRDLGELDNPEKFNTFVRSVTNKEDHAQKVKQEIYILWSDYFKSEHFEKHSELHDLLRNTAKQASTVKQTVSIAETETLIAMVAEVARLFAATKQG